MKVYSDGVFLGCNQRTGKDGKKYNNINVDFDGEIMSLNARDISPFLSLNKYSRYRFQLFYGSYATKTGGRSNFLLIEGAEPLK